VGENHQEEDEDFGERGMPLLRELAHADTDTVKRIARQFAESVLAECEGDVERSAFCGFSRIGLYVREFPREAHLGLFPAYSLCKRLGALPAQNSEFYSSIIANACANASEGDDTTIELVRLFADHGHAFGIAPAHLRKIQDLASQTSHRHGSQDRRDRDDDRSRSLEDKFNRRSLEDNRYDARSRSRSRSRRHSRSPEYSRRRETEAAEDDRRDHLERRRTTDDNTVEDRGVVYAVTPTTCFAKWKGCVDLYVTQADVEKAGNVRFGDEISFFVKRGPDGRNVAADVKLVRRAAREFGILVEHRGYRLGRGPVLDVRDARNKCHKYLAHGPEALDHDPPLQPGERIVFSLSDHACYKGDGAANARRRFKGRVVGFRSTDVAVIERDQGDAAAFLPERFHANLADDVVYAEHRSRDLAVGDPVEFSVESQRPLHCTRARELREMPLKDALQDKRGGLRFSVIAVDVLPLLGNGAGGRDDN